MAGLSIGVAVDVLTHLSGGIVARIVFSAAFAFGGIFFLVAGTGHLRGGVLVREPDDLFVIRQNNGRQRRIAWRSVARFRADTTGGEWDLPVLVVEMRDGSSVRLRGVAMGDWSEAAARLNAMLDDHDFHRVWRRHATQITYRR